MAYDHEELKEKYTIIRKIKSIKSRKEWFHSYNHKIVSYQRQIFYSKDKYIVPNSLTLKYLLLAKKQLSAGNL